MQAPVASETAQAACANVDESPHLLVLSLPPEGIEKRANVRASTLHAQFSI